MSKRESSQITSDLDTRIRTNQAFGDNDLDQWLVSVLAPKQGERILDAGCGTGNHLIKLAKSAAGDYECVGFDLSEPSIAEARTKASSSGVEARFLVANLNHLNSDVIADGAFDIVTSIYAIYYADDAKSALTTLARKLKPTGRMAVMGPHGDNNKQWFEFLSQFMKLPANIERISARFMDEEVRPFAENQFERVQILEFVNNIRIPTYADLKNYWVSNVYYKEELDGQFEACAQQHFAKFQSFDFFKKGLLILMNGRRGAGSRA